MRAIGDDGKWHDWADLTDGEKAAWREAMNEADRIHEYYKYHERPRTLKQNLVDYEKKQQVIHY